MNTTYATLVVGHGNHAAIKIPDKNLKELGANKRAPLKITINGYTYQSTATGVNGKCMVVFSRRDREAAGVKSGDQIIVHLELDDGYREVKIPAELDEAMGSNGVSKIFQNLTYSKRNEYARQVSEAKTAETKIRRINKIVDELIN